MLEWSNQAMETHAFLSRTGGYWGLRRPFITVYRCLVCLLVTIREAI